MLEKIKRTALKATNILMIFMLGMCGYKVLFEEVYTFAWCHWMMLAILVGMALCIPRAFNAMAGYCDDEDN